MRTPLTLPNARLRFDAGTTHSPELTQERESVRPPTINGAILPAKFRVRAFTAADTGTHEVICPHGTMLAERPSTDRTATS
jgi:hypothetical protein